MTPQVALGSPMRGSLCSSPMVSSAARPGATIFGPPEKPAKKCGSTKPSVMRASASRKARSTNTGTLEPGTVPSCACAARSSASCWTSSQAARISAPNMASSSSGVHGRWLPVATTRRMRRPGSSPISTGRTVRAGNGRVTSQTLTATVAPRGTRCASGAPKPGLRMAFRSDASTSASPGAERGRSTSTLAGTSITRPVRPKSRRTLLTRQASGARGATSTVDQNLRFGRARTAAMDPVESSPDAVTAPRMPCPIASAISPIRGPRLR